jgi:hypothetical protein
MLPLFQIHEIFIYCHFYYKSIICILSSTFEDAVTIFPPIVLVCEKICEKNKIKHVCKHNLLELCGKIKYYMTNVYSSSD